MSDEVVYYGAVNEEVKPLLGRFRKSSESQFDTSEKIGFFAAPFRHPLSEILRVVRQAYNYCLKKTTAFEDQHPRQNFNGKAYKDALNNMIQETEETALPVPRKVLAGRGKILQVLRYPVMAVKNLTKTK